MAIDDPFEGNTFPENVGEESECTLTPFRNGVEREGNHCWLSTSRKAMMMKALSSGRAVTRLRTRAARGKNKGGDRIVFDGCAELHDRCSTS
jgi:hypothetical protein